MKLIAILKISSSSTLSVLNKEDDLYNLVSLDMLDNKTCLSETYSKLKSLEVSELHVVIQGSLTSKVQDQIITEKFGRGKFTKYSVIANSDIQKIKTLANRLDVVDLFVYDTIHIIKYMSKDNDLLIGSEYLNDMYSYIMIKKGIVTDFRIWREVDSDFINNMREEHNNPKYISVYNNILDKELSRKIVNWDKLPYDARESLNLNLGCLLINPTITKDYTKTALNSQTGKHKPVDMKPNKDLVSDKTETQKYLEHLEQETVEENMLFDKILNTLAYIVIVISMACYVANTQLPQDIDYLGDKKTELSEVVKPKIESKKYYNAFSNYNGEGSFDSKYINAIQAIELDGFLAEVKLQNSNVSVVVYFKGGSENSSEVKSKLDEYGGKLRAYIDITQVIDQGVVTLEDTQLTKYIINGTRDSGTDN